MTTEMISPEAAPSPAPAAKTVAHSFWTLSRRFAALLSLAIIAGFGTILLLNASESRQNMFDLAVQGNAALSEMIADRASGGMRWEKKDAVEEAYAGMAGKPHSQIAGVLVFDKTGNPFTSYASDKLPRIDLSGALAIDAATLAKDTVVHKQMGQHFVGVVPILQGKDKNRVGTMAIAWSMASLTDELRASELRSLAIAGGATVLILVVILLLFRHQIEKPLGAMNTVMGRIGAGDTDVTVPGLQRSDDIGAMARMIEVFRGNAVEVARMAVERERTIAEKAEVDRQIAEKDKRVAEERIKSEKRAATERREALLALANQFEASVKTVVDAVSASSTEMQATAQAMTATAEETSRQSTVVAAASEQATNNVQTVASATEELSASVSEISSQVLQSNKIAQNAVEQAERTNAEIRELAVAARKIDEVVKLISDIAAQTNLLALNATIEAARAGDAGKGFAVVASEVKSLATQTAQATDDITAQIAAVQGATTNAVSAIAGITKVIGEINEISAAVAAAVEEQGAATQEIARNVQEAASGTREVSNNITGVTQASAETGTSAQMVLKAASGLTQQTDALSVEVGRFLTKVRTG